MYSIYSSGKGLKGLILAVIIAVLVIYRERHIQRELALEHRHGRAEAGLALVRYVQLRRLCSEEAAYQRIAAFVRNYTPLNEHPMIDRFFADDRQGLLELAQDILRQEPDEIDEI